MSDDADRFLRLTFDELDQAIRSADSGAYLVLPRVLRRVIKRDRGLAGFGLSVPHRKCCVVRRERLLEFADPDEIGAELSEWLPERIILLARPGARTLEETPADKVLARCWRLLYHARIHAALEEAEADGRLSPSTVHRRIMEIGSGEFDAIRLVLAQEDMLLPPATDASTYVEFAAVYLELRHFAPDLLPSYFPGLEDWEAVDAMLRRDVDSDALFEATRPPGAPLPGHFEGWKTLLRDAWEDGFAEMDVTEPDAAGTEQPESAAIEPAAAPSLSKYRALMRKSRRPAAAGNVVRAAIWHVRAARYAPQEYAERARAAVKADVRQLSDRLHAALELAEDGSRSWVDSLDVLAVEASQGVWTAEGRLLYDLQKICVDHERDLYTIDLVEWVVSRGRRPIKRPLPHQRDVLMLKHLRSAAGRLAAVRLSVSRRRELGAMLHEAGRQVETRLRRGLRPPIAEALDAVGLTPNNLPERIARDKLIEELLDRIVERGFLSMGDLRDAISRNDLKLPDLAGLSDLLHGDRLLRANERLAENLDGVYRRGEAYLRWMQRFSSLAFGTKTGRLLTRFVAVPFGGAYVILAGLHHLWEMFSGTGPPPPVAALDAAAEAAPAVAPPVHGFHLVSLESVAVLGLFLLFAVNSAAFRRAVGSFFRTLYAVFRAAVVEPALWFFQWPLLRRLAQSRPFVLTIRFLVKPLVWTAAAWFVLPPEPNWRTMAGTLACLFLGFNLFLNSRLGRNLEEVILDAAVQGWRRFGLRAVTNVFWAVVDFFRAILQLIERLLYAVDEWLRFRSGQSRWTLAVKALLGLAWSVAAYVLRFAVNVLIEPQINPIKHFPVVTVSHKLLLPLIPHFSKVLMGVGLEKALAVTVATAIITSIPGVFGFLVWELKENWRLYAANRRRTLGPVMIGSHGETMPRLLRPGFHSGTVPKRFAKLRRAERRARAGGSPNAARKHLRALHHVEESVRRFVEREFLALLGQARFFNNVGLRLDNVRLGVNSIRLAFGCCDHNGPVLNVAWQVESGWLTASAASPFWTPGLSSAQRAVLTAALIGLYHKAGVELVRQQIENQFAPLAPDYALTPEGLVVWPDAQWEIESFYDLREESWIAPQAVRGLSRQTLPTLARDQLFMGESPIAWDRWIAGWQRDDDGPQGPLNPLASMRVLP